MHHLVYVTLPRATGDRAVPAPVPHPSLHQFTSFGATIILPAPRSLLAIPRLLAQVEGDIPVLDHVSATHQLISPFPHYSYRHPQGRDDAAT